MKFMSSSLISERILWITAMVAFLDESIVGELIEKAIPVKVAWTITEHRPKIRAINYFILKNNYILFI